jgi:hypothetical protein
MSEPTSQPPPPAKEAEDRRASARELTKAYKRCFATDDGKRVLADLRARYHWGDDPYQHGISHADLAQRCGLHSPLRHIAKMIEADLGETTKKPKAAKAKSGLEERK